MEICVACGWRKTEENFCSDKLLTNWRKWNGLKYADSWNASHAEPALFEGAMNIVGLSVTCLFHRSQSQRPEQIYSFLLNLWKQTPHPGVMMRYVPPLKIFLNHCPCTQTSFVVWKIPFALFLNSCLRPQNFLKRVPVGECVFTKHHRNENILLMLFQSVFLFLTNTGLLWKETHWGCGLDNSLYCCQCEIKTRLYVTFQLHCR